MNKEIVLFVGVSILLALGLAWMILYGPRYQVLINRDSGAGSIIEVRKFRDAQWSLSGRDGGHPDLTRAVESFSRSASERIDDAYRDVTSGRWRVEAVLQRSDSSGWAVLSNGSRRRRVSLSSCWQQHHEWYCQVGGEIATEGSGR